MKNLLILLLVLNCQLSIINSVFSQKQDKTVTYLYDEGAQPPEMIIDISHLKAEVVKIEPKTKYLETKTTYTFKVLRSSVDSIVFNSPGLKVTKCSINNIDALYKTEGDKIVVFPKQKLELQKEYTIYFECNTVLDSPWPVFTGWDDETNTKRKQIWGFSYSRIFPDINIKHDLMSTELIITFDSHYKVLSNGERIMQRENKDGTTTWHYKVINQHYFAMLNFVIGDYNYETFKTDRGLKLEYWYYADKKECFEPTYRYSKQMFSFFEKEMGLEYPWELYRNVPVIDCPFGGMETTTSTIYNDMMQVDARGYLERNYINVNAHELAHQWFGDFTSYTNGQNVWVSESFATYWAKKFEQSVLGENQYQKIRNDELNSTLDAAKRDDYPVGHGKGATARWYPKGSLVIDMLRYVMGEDEFKYFISYYLHKHKYAVVDGNDLKVAIRESTGRSMDWFFDEWINRGGEPNYKISYKQLETLKGDRNTHISVTQVQETNDLVGYFKMPVVIEVHYKDGTMDTKKEWIENPFSEVIIPNKDKKEIAFVLFDPTRNIVKRLTFDRSFDELSSQLTDAKNMIDRYDALLEMRKIDIDKKRDVLIKSFDKENFFLNKSEIIAQLAVDNNNATKDLVVKAINDKDVNVRKAVVANIRSIDESIRQDYEKLLTDSSYSVIVAALDNLVFNVPNNTDKYLDITKNTEGSIGKNVRIKWLEIAYNTKKDEQYIKELAEYCNIKRYESITVLNAEKAIKRLNYLNPTLAQYLFENAIYWNSRINPDAKDALTFFYDQDQYKHLLKDEFQKLDQPKKDKLRDVIK